MNIIQKNWSWPNALTARQSTKYCVWHHSACSNQMQDTDEIWQEHINIGDNGIAYTRILKGNGDTVQGRPDWAVSAAAHGANFCSIDIVVEGDFEASESSEKPTDAQIQAVKNNMVDINQKYPGIIHCGHYQVQYISGDPGDATACPGSTFIAMLPDLIKETKGLFYQR